MTSVRLFLFTLVSTLCPSVVYAWESDFHYGVTKWIAEQVGFRSDYAELVAAGNENLDRSAVNALHLVFFYACLNDDEEMSRIVQENHFPSTGRVPSWAKERRVVKGSKAAYRLIRNELITEVDPASEGERTGSLRRLGKAVHAYQDSWSHQGIPDAPTGIPYVMKCNARLSWGHPKRRGGYLSHKADHTFEYPVDALESAKATRDALEDYLKVHSWAKRNTATQPVKWPQLESKLRSFAQAKTRDEKFDWFKAQSFTNMNFLSGSSLRTAIPAMPDGIFYASLTAKAVPAFVKTERPPEDVMRAFEEFFKAVLVDRTGDETLRKLVATQTMAASMGMALTPNLADQTRAVIEDLKLWRLKDYGTALRIMRDRRATGVIASTELLQIAGYVVNYESLKAAVHPIDGMDFFASTLPGPLQLDGVVIDKGYAAVAVPRHTANTALLAIGAKAEKGFRILIFQPHLMH